MKRGDGAENKLIFLLTLNLLIMTSVMTGCVPTRVTDLSFHKLGIVDYDSVPFREEVGGSGKHPGEKVLRVEFSSTAELGSIAKRKEVNLWLRANMCSERPSPLIAYSAIYLGDVEVGKFGYRDKEKEHYLELARKTPPGMPYQYHFYMEYKNDREGTLGNMTEGAPVYHPYDLIRDPSDVCVTIKGGGMHAVYLLFHSNTFVIPKKAFAEISR